MATLVSTVSGATRLSLEITALCWEAIFDTIQEGTSSGLWLSSAAFEEARTLALAVASVFSPLSALNPQIVSRIISSSTAAGLSMMNNSLTAAENLVEGGFSLYTKAVNMSIHAAGESVRFFDAVFGSTDTSRVLASFVHMCRREAIEKNPEIRALIKEHGFVGFVSQLVKTVTAWTCLQVVTHGRPRSYRMDLVYTNIHAKSAFCPRRFVGSDGKLLPSSSGRASARRPSSMSPYGVSPRIQAAGASGGAINGRLQSPPTVTQNGLLAVMPNEHSFAIDSAAHTSWHMQAQGASEASAPSHERFSLPHADARSDYFDVNEDAAVVMSDTDDDVYYPLSDQEVSHRDPEWDQRLMEALQTLAMQSDRREQERREASKKDKGGEEIKGNESALPRANSKQSLWDTLHMMRGAALDDSGAQESSSESSSSQYSPTMPSVAQNGVFPAFESAPASLLSSPQFPANPATAEPNPLHRSHTNPEHQSQPSSATAPGLQSLGAFPSVFVDATPDPLESSPQVGVSEWMQQEFPRKPLLVNLARFVTMASSVYGKSFMQAIGLKSGIIDSRALIEEFGDFEVHDNDHSGHRLSYSGSVSSMDNAMGAVQGGSSNRHSRNPSTSRLLPRAQPMSSYHTHSGYNPARPNSQRQYERRHFGRSSRPETPGGSKTSGRRPPVRRLHHRRRPVAEHPNHYCFSQHTGISLGDLLFSSYVTPIVPGVTRAANAQASAVEREIRNKQSGKKKSKGNSKKKAKSAEKLDTAATTSSKPLVDCSSDTKGGGWFSSIPIVGSIYQSLPSPMSALSSVPIIPGLVSRVLGSSPASETADQQPDGRSKSGEDNSKQKPYPQNTSQGQGQQKQQQSIEAAMTSGGIQPTLNQFRRFDKIRQRLVYRNPSIHALVHYIAVDHASRSVVLACRGTLGISDLFIDMICEYETIQLPGHPATKEQTEFRVHSGMWHSAMMLADASSEVFREVAEALRLYPEYGLVLTGHSLGGGVASLLTLLWSQPLFDHNSSGAGGDVPGSTGGLPPTPGSTAGGARRFATTDKFGLVTPRPIHCFSYGSPCSTNAALSFYCRGLVTSVANTDDFVTFMSIGSFVDILHISAVLSRERGVAETIVRRFLSAQRSKISSKFNLFDFDFSKLRAYAHSDDDDGEQEQENGGGENKDAEESSSGGKYWWSRKTVSKDSGNKKGAKANSRANKNATDMRSDSGDSASASPPLKRRKSESPDKQKPAQNKNDLDDWHWSLVKTLRANMDSEKLYPPGDVFVLASPGDDEVADKRLSAVVDNVSVASQSTAKESSTTETSDMGSKTLPMSVGLFYCPDVTERFCELRFTRNMIFHHLPSMYERKIAALVHGVVP
ncbi:hypothetical protein GGI07_003322 [Coemansia sp. Benny D115]|nr:hypothetical protein GGI07_003322 [Coemansia sp. Benny D115]